MTGTFTIDVRRIFGKNNSENNYDVPIIIMGLVGSEYRGREYHQRKRQKHCCTVLPSKTFA